MTDATPSEPTAPAPDPAMARPPRVRGRKRAFAYRWSRRVLFLVVGLIAALLVSLFTLDLGRIDVGGRSLRQLAEQEGTKYLKRPLHVGRIRALLWPGAFELSDVVIDGRRPGDRPFLHARSIRVHVNWRTLLRQKRELFLDIHMTDWQMVMEMFRDGNNLPKLTPERRPDQPRGPRRFTTTVRVTADGGQYTFEDHNTPWKVVAPNLTFTLARDHAANAYAGQAEFKQGIVQIQDFKPMQAAMTTQFVMGEGGRWNLQHIDLLTDGAVTHLNGYVDFSKGRPDQHYEIRSTVDFVRMREIFFSNAPWRLAGEGQFRGLFEVFSSGGFSLGGQFWSDQARVDDLAFSNLHGTLEWLPSRFAVTQAQAEFHGGHTTFVYELDRRHPRGTMASLHTTYDDINLTSLGRQFSLDELNLVGRAAGHFNLVWPNGRFGLAAGDGQTTVTPPPGIPLATAELPSVAPAAMHAGRNSPPPPLTALAFGASVEYRIDPEWLTFAESWAATPATFVSFQGRTAWGQRSEIPFHVTSHDWQESDRVLAAVLTLFGNRTGVFTVSGRGTFDGTMTESFRAARIAGRFNAEDMYAWDVTWGRATGDLVIQNSYLDITGGLIGGPDGPFIRADGRFALGYPRKDGGEEMNARVVVKDWPLADIRKAFEQDDWPIDGTIAHADLKLNGPYEGLFGGGDLRITNGVAWEETFDSASGNLQFEGTSVFVQGLEVIKSSRAGGTSPGYLKGSAHLFWSGRFSFGAEGDRIPVESLDNFRVEGLPLTGMLKIERVTGEGTLENPIYKVQASIADLYIGDEGIGFVTGRIIIQNDVLQLESLEVASQRLALSGSGSIKLSESYDSNLDFRITDASIDPFLKFVGAAGVSPYTRINVNGSTSINGPLADSTKLNVGVTLSKAFVTLLEGYTLQNPDDEPIQLTFANNNFQITTLRLLGRPRDVVRAQAEDESLVLSGGVNVGNRMVDIRVDGEANLAVMQVFFTDVSASGTARLEASIRGPFDSFGMTGDARISNGSIRYFGLPHSLTNLNGPIHFATDAVDVSGLTARMGEGDVTFNGRIFLAEGYRPTEFDIRANGTSMRLRYPPGVRSTVDAELTLTGPINSPLLAGTVSVHHINYSPRAEDQTAIMGIASGGAAAALEPLPSEESGFPLRFDISIDMETQRIIQHQNGWIEGSAHLRFSGAYDRPSLTGQIDIEGGEYIFAGNRYFVRRGTIDFVNPSRVQPIFDVQVETRARVPGQTFQVNIRLSGTFDRISPTLTSDPWLPDEEIISLLLGGTPDLGRIEEQRLGSPQQVQERMLRNAGAVLLISPISSRLGNAFTEALPITNLQITPTFGGNAALQQLDPSARITVGRRISNNVYLTYSVALNDAQSELIMLEYDQSDRLSWVLSRNGDRTFALDFRIRYVF